MGLAIIFCESHDDLRARRMLRECLLYLEQRWAFSSLLFEGAHKSRDIDDIIKCDEEKFQNMKEIYMECSGLEKGSEAIELLFSPDKLEPSTRSALLRYYLREANKESKQTIIRIADAVMECLAGSTLLGILKRAKDIGLNVKGMDIRDLGKRIDTDFASFVSEDHVDSLSGIREKHFVENLAQVLDSGQNAIVIVGYAHSKAFSELERQHDIRRITMLDPMTRDAIEKEFCSGGKIKSFDIADMNPSQFMQAFDQWLTAGFPKMPLLRQLKGCCQWLFSPPPSRHGKCSREMIWQRDKFCKDVSRSCPSIILEKVVLDALGSHDIPALETPLHAINILTSLGPKPVKAMISQKY